MSDQPAEPTLGARFAAARKRLGWTLRDAERASGVPNAHISQVETGTIAQPGAGVVARLATAYGMDDLLVAVPQAAVAAALSARDESQSMTDEGLARDMLEAAAPHIAEAERAKLQPAIDRVTRLAEAAQEKAVAVAVAAEREQAAGRIGVKMHRQPHGHAGFADGWETAASYAQEIARNPDCEVAPLADLVRQMRLKAGKPSSTPRDYFEDGRAAERERLTAMAEKVDAHSWYDDDGSGIAVKVPFADVIRKDAAP